MKLNIFRICMILIILVLPFTHVAAASETPVIRAVLFYSPNCDRCHEVMEQVLPPLVEQYPSKLDIVGVDVDHPVGQNLYQQMITFFNVPDDRLGVPTLVVGSNVLVGLFEIRDSFPEIIRTGLTAEGFDWPQIPGLEDVLAVQGDSSTIDSQPRAPQPGTVQEGNPGFITRFKQDPLANSIAVVVLVGMIASCLVVLLSYLRGADQKFQKFPDWLLPATTILGLGVALYLSYIEVSRTNAVCGPVGNCNSVQESSYAYLFGFIPVGIVGAIGYLAILFAWLMKIYGPTGNRKMFTLAIWGMAWFGVLFSIYLTFLEPFVIGATCAWCISSAILITLILLSSTAEAKDALRIDLDDEFDVGEEESGAIESL